MATGMLNEKKFWAIYEDYLSSGLSIRDYCAKQERQVGLSAVLTQTGINSLAAIVAFSAFRFGLCLALAVQKI